MPENNNRATEAVQSLLEKGNMQAFQIEAPGKERLSAEDKEEEDGFHIDGFCEFIAKNQRVRFLTMTGVQFGFSWASLISGFTLNDTCTLFAIIFFAFKTFTSHSMNCKGWWRDVTGEMSPNDKTKVMELPERLWILAKAPLFIVGDILDVKLNHINFYRMLGLYTNFTITVASFFATASQTSIAAALPCLVAFDFLRDIFDREKVSLS
jgi:hypothetical protein